jgi:rod shape determining protein RodA
MVRESKVDWFTVLLYIIMIVTGWANLYSVVRDDNEVLWSMNTPYGRQLIFIGAALAGGIIILILDTKFLEFISYILYGLSLALLITTMFLPETRNTSSFINLWGFGIQPTEFAKFSTIMALAKYMSRYNFSMSRVQDVLLCGLLVIAPMGLILAQNDAGSALVFPGLILIFFREGLHPLFLLALFTFVVVVVLTVLFAHSVAAVIILFIFIALFVMLIWFFVSQRKFLAVHLIAMGICFGIVLGGNLFIQPHQSSRMRVLITPEEKMSEPDKETYYNLRESLVAIGSGGPLGKGFGNATHTRGDFVPEEHTDYIFCVISEEHGFLGASILLLLFLVLLWRIIHMAENSKTRYARIYGYGAASIIFMHVMINVGMTIGLLPTIGIPLVFYSYGGSSMIAFSFMLFILMNHYSYRTNIMR